MIHPSTGGCRIQGILPLDEILDGGEKYDVCSTQGFSRSQHVSNELTDLPLEMSGPTLDDQ